MTHDPTAESDHIREAAEMATPGRWKSWGMSVMADQDGTSNVDTAVHVAFTASTDAEGRPRTYDADWIIATQPENILPLLDQLDALRAVGFAEEVLRSKLRTAEAAARRIEAVLAEREQFNGAVMSNARYGEGFADGWAAAIADVRATLRDVRTSPEGATS